MGRSHPRTGVELDLPGIFPSLIHGPALVLYSCRHAGKRLGPSELRTSLSRSYYAVFNVAVAFLQQMGIEPVSGPQAHSAVKNGLLASQDAGLVKIGSDLDTLHAERRRADYDMGDVRCESSKTAAAVFKHAGRMLAALDSCRLAPACT